MEEEYETNHNNSASPNIFHTSAFNSSNASMSSSVSPSCSSPLHFYRNSSLHEIKAEKNLNNDLIETSLRTFNCSTMKRYKLLMSVMLIIATVCVLIRNTSVKTQNKGKDLNRLWKLYSQALCLTYTTPV